MHQENLEHESHCKYQIKEYVQSYNKPHHKNTNADQSLDLVYISPINTAQGGNKLLHLKTNKFVKCQKSSKIPITSSTIKIACNGNPRKHAAGVKKNN